MDVTQALKDAENVLRDFLLSQLTSRYGQNWLESIGVSEDRIVKWKERKSEEAKSFSSGNIDERILYYADFYDLETIIHKNWDSEMKEALGDKKEILLFLKLLGKYRNPDAHRRELLPHQKHLVLGISGEIKTRLVKYRSMKEDSSENYYPKFDIVQDNYGNKIISNQYSKKSSTILRPGDTIEFILTASDPYGEELEFWGSVYAGGELTKTSGNTFSIRIEENHVRDSFDIEFFVRSKREYHREGSIDDRARFSYKVLPPKK
ncbi:hypothetical protein [Tenacibaculum sp. 47A_GOM-205m]|uniref:hypothetical protein n=1 Tax=Tenacibaculum sp. 47A_GOM-205m TaxID=1380384 RepID=UPI000491B39E|nr:hypothetical protein [Tenacibaculum sp. 47A_GOM-205m]